MTALGAFAAAAVALMLPRPLALRLRPYGNVAVGAAAAVFVLHMQRAGLGPSIGGVVLAVSAGAVAVLILTLFRSV